MIIIVDVQVHNPTETIQMLKGMSGTASVAEATKPFVDADEVSWFGHTCTCLAETHEPNHKQPSTAISKNDITTLGLDWIGCVSTGYHLVESANRLASHE